MSLSKVESLSKLLVTSFSFIFNNFIVSLLLNNAYVMPIRSRPRRHIYNRPKNVGRHAIQVGYRLEYCLGCAVTFTIKT